MVTTGTSQDVGGVGLEGTLQTGVRVQGLEFRSSLYWTLRWVMVSVLVEAIEHCEYYYVVALYNVYYL